jgi:hypothetical protein
MLNVDAENDPVSGQPVVKVIAHGERCPELDSRRITGSVTAPVNDMSAASYECEIDWRPIA